MTMHLLGPQYTSLRISKTKKELKITEKFMQDFREYNKLMRRCKTKEKTLDEYIQYRKGNYRGKTNPKPKTIVVHSTESKHREMYPSYGDQAGTIPAKPEKTYTGTYVKGIAVSHKSNLIPITSQQQAEDVAKMRRN